MEENLILKKETLEKDLESLLKLVKEKTNISETIKIYENLISIIKSEIETGDQPKQKCNSCGEPLEHWEKGICGPCKIADERYEEEEE